MEQEKPELRRSPQEIKNLENHASQFPLYPTIICRTTARLDSSFVKESNWQKATEKCNEHEKSKLHSDAIQILSAPKKLLMPFYETLLANLRIQQGMYWNSCSGQRSSWERRGQLFEVTAAIQHTTSQKKENSCLKISGSLTQYRIK